MRVRPAAPRDARAVADIYNEGIEERQATFETRSRTPDEVAAGFADERLPFLVAERDGRVVGWAAVSAYSDRCAYTGVGECSVYVARSARGGGVGRALIEALAVEAERRGFHKLLGRLFPANVASVRLLRCCGFSDVGVHRRHARLDGEWRDVVVVERLLGDAARAP